MNHAIQKRARVHGGPGARATVHGNGRPRSILSKTDGRDRTVHDRLTGSGNDDVSDDDSDDVSTGGGSGAQARRRTTALWHKRRAPTGRARCGELTGDQRSGGGTTDSAGDEEEAAAEIGLTAATELWRSSAAAKGRTRTAATWRPRRWPSRVTTTTVATTAHDWSGGDDGGAKAHGARALHMTAGEGKGGDG
uniref:Retrotransposon protein, putative, Ty3-gypsy subclass n=1 Tax=Oryza sativa subsp. japonica TaxID=39947 RepID=Q6UU27_ORYSJ|nr:hypothetical protein OSJNBa0096K16.16 [Oryza sativa Japonica Group]